jgi:hypothetical protein
MRTRREKPERGKVTEQVESKQTDMRERANQIEEHVADTETARETLEQLEGGTQDGADEVTQSVEAAREVSVGEFEQDSEELERVHSESQEFEGELREHADDATSDVEKISDASGQIHSESVGQELGRAREAAERDVEFLKEHEERAVEAREESQRVHEEHRDRGDAARGS